MPFSVPDGPHAMNVSKEAAKFARLFRTVPVVGGAPNHPAVRPMLRSFRNINRALATRDANGYVSLAQQARMGREFAKIGAALQVWPKRKAKKSTRGRRKQT